MDKVMKAEIEKILEELLFGKQQTGRIILSQEQKQRLSQATSSITALIIKWLEGKMSKLNNSSNNYRGLNGEALRTSNRDIANRNQLITELIGEVR